MREPSANRMRMAWFLVDEPWSRFDYSTTWRSRGYDFHEQAILGAATGEPARGDGDGGRHRDRHACEHGPREAAGPLHRPLDALAERRGGGGLGEHRQVCDRAGHAGRARV